MDLPQRPRRLRQNPALRALVRETRVTTDDLVMPLFVFEGEGDPQPIPSMPGQYRFSLTDLVRECENLAELGLRGVALFPVLPADRKDATGAEALNPETLVLRAIRAVKGAVPELLVFADVALDPYTSHGHDGVLTADESDVANDETVAILEKMAVLAAGARVDFVAPSDMMDGRVGAIRAALDKAGYQRTGILAYSAKFASAFYGPFRDAVGSASAAGTNLLGKHTYQLDPSNRRQALTEARLDEDEAADVLMVKPAGPYLDILREIREETELPLAAYQVSGEYAMLCAAAEKGWLDRPVCREEALLAIKRAGADLILTYFAKEVARDRRGLASEVGNLPDQAAGTGI